MRDLDDKMLLSLKECLAALDQLHREGLKEYYPVTDTARMVITERDTHPKDSIDPEIRIIIDYAQLVVALLLWGDNKWGLEKQLKQEAVVLAERVQQLVQEAHKQ